ncbi:secretin receptor-like [Liolophura sinensis]|uniref:secretin receptor-like n=1 Tax=Liolophura sinensis TaxID=3198878 RepID=UPI003157FCF6
MQASIDCAQSMMLAPSLRNGTYCSRVWDLILCWPDTPAGVTATQPCPAYINGFNTSARATRACLSDGSWYMKHSSNKSWTNYSSCTVPQSTDDVFDIPELVAAHMWRIRLIYNIGYGISMVSLVLAVFLMFYFKKLHCPRNTIHINLFLSFILRSAVSFMKENLLVQGLGFQSDVIETESGKLEFSPDGPHWECRLFFTIFNYILGSNYMWIFVEGLYLHTLLTVGVFSEKSGIRWYILSGWCGPLLSVIPWVIVRVFLENDLCWNTHQTPGYFWIMRGPIVATILVNFLFFLNIVRLLFTKLNAGNSQEAQKYRYRKLAKSTLVLIPLFGIHYMVFLGLPDRIDDNGRSELVKLYFEMFFNSFQGFFVAILFCFLNGEVQAEILKKWHRYNLRRAHGSGRNRSYWNTVSSYMTKPRGSLHSLHSTVDKRGSVTSQANGSCATEKSERSSGVSGKISWCRKLNCADFHKNSNITKKKQFKTIPEQEEMHPMVTGMSWANRETEQDYTGAEQSRIRTVHPPLRRCGNSPAENVMAHEKLTIDDNLEKEIIPFVD